MDEANLQSDYHTDCYIFADRLTTCLDASQSGKVCSLNARQFSQVSIEFRKLPTRYITEQLLELLR